MQGLLALLGLGSATAGQPSVFGLELAPPASGQEESFAAQLRQLQAQAAGGVLPTQPAMPVLPETASGAAELALDPWVRARRAAFESGAELPEGIMPPLGVPQPIMPLEESHVAVVALDPVALALARGGKPTADSADIGVPEQALPSTPLEMLPGQPEEQAVPQMPPGVGTGLPEVATEAPSFAPPSLQPVSVPPTQVALQVAKDVVQDNAPELLDEVSQVSPLLLTVPTVAPVVQLEALPPEQQAATAVASASPPPAPPRTLWQVAYNAPSSPTVQVSDSDAPDALRAGVLHDAPQEASVLRPPASVTPPPVPAEASGVADPLTRALTPQAQPFVFQPERAPAEADIALFSDDALSAPRGSSASAPHAFEAHTALRTTAGLDASSATRFVVVTPQQAGNATPAQQIAAHISRLREDKQEGLVIRLHPAELGRVELRLQVDADQQASLRIIADSKDTFDLLRADKVNLERILQDSGLRLDGNALHFSHRGTGGQQEATGSGTGGGGHAASGGSAGATERADAADTPTEDYTALLVSSGVNITV